MRWRLQPHAMEAATPCDGGCNPVRWRLQPFVTEAAALWMYPPRAEDIPPTAEDTPPTVTEAATPKATEAGRACVLLGTNSRECTGACGSDSMRSSLPPGLGG